MFPSVACSSYFGYFVQFSRCVWSLVETRSKHSVNQMLESKLKKIKVLFASFFFQEKGSGGPKWTRTTDLTIISRAL